MVQALPTGEIKVCNNLETCFANIVYTRSNSNTGYIYTLDIKCNDDLKKKTKKHPFFPEKTKASVDTFRDYKKK